MEIKLAKGDSAPEFSLMDQDGNKHEKKDYAGKYLLVYFYPKALTPGCTTQSCAVGEAKEDFSALNCSVLGISPDNPEKQKKFDEKYELGFPLLSDEDHSTAEAFGVWGEKNMYGKKYFGIIRSSFLIDPEGKIVEAWYKVKPGDTVPKALAELNKVRGE